MAQLSGYVGPVQAKSFSDTRPRRKIRSWHAVLILMAVAISYWLWFGLSDRSIFQDEGISLLAAKGIVEHGYPLLPSGFIYDRGYLPNYLVAGSIYAFGFNQFAIMLPSLMFGIGSLWLVFVFGRDVFGRPWVGILSVIILLTLQIETLYATSPRMYMSLQFFTMLAIYSAWRGYINRSTKYQVVAILAAIGAMLSHDQGTALIIGLPLSLMLSAWILRGEFTSLINFQTLLGLLVLAAVAYFVVVYIPPGVTPLVTAFVYDGGSSLLGLRINPIDWIESDIGLKETAGYGFGFVPLIVFITISMSRRRWRDSHPGAIYLLSLVSISAGITVLGTSEVSERMWFFILPLYVILFSMGVSYLVEKRAGYLVNWVRKISFLTPLKLTPFILVFIALLLSAIAVGIGTPALKGTLGVVGIPCQDNNCDGMIKSHYARVSQDIAMEDLVISSNPFVTDFYLRKVNGYLRDKVIIGRDSSVIEYDFLTDEYFGIPLYDAADLARIQDQEARVWIITDERVQWISSRDTVEVLQNNYIKHQVSDDLITFYMNCQITFCK